MPGGLTASIRRKLQDGIAPEDIVQELAATGMSATSAQRFVDRAVLEHQSAPPLPDAPLDSFDQFNQNTPVATEAAAATTGGKAVWIGAAVVVAGVVATGIWLTMSGGDATESATSSSINIDPASLAAPATGAAVMNLIVRFEETTQPEIQCDIARQLATAKGEDAVDVVDGLMEHYDDLPATVQTCVRDTVTKLDPTVKF